MPPSDFNSNRDLFRQLLLSSPDPVWIIDDNKFVECNEVAVRTLGYTCREELLKVHPSKLSPPFQPGGQDSFDKAERMMAIAKEKGAHRFEWKHRKADGTSFDAEVTLSIVELENRSVIYCVWRDLTAIKQAEKDLQRREKQLKALATLSSDWFWNQDEEFRFIEFSGAFANDFTPPANTIGKTRWELNIDLTPAQWAAHRAILDAHLPFRSLEYPIAGDDGEVRRYSINGDPLFDETGRFSGYHGTGRNITERKKAEELVRIAATAFESQQSMTITDPQGTILQVNRSFTRDNGYSAEEAIGKSLRLLHSGRQDAMFYKAMWDSISSSGFWQGELWNRRKNGDIYPAWLAISAVKNDAGAITHFVGACSDITARKAAEDQLRKLSQAVEQSSDNIIITDANAVIEYVNDAFVRNTGYSRDEMIGKNPRILQSGHTPPKSFTTMWDALTHGSPWRGEFYNQRKDGSHYLELAAVSPIHQSDGTLTHYVSVQTDITAQKAAAEQIEKFAYYDPLTGLANRRLLLDRLQHAMAAGIRDKRQGAVLYIDLDNFKEVNDALGHAEGDLMLKQAGERLTACIRESDTAARLGGDEFVVLFEDINEGVLDAATQVQTMGEKILAELKHTYLLASGPHDGTASIGVALFGGASETDAEGPLKRADQAMYQAKAAGRNTLRFFDPQLQALASAQIALDAGLREALEKRQFVLHYQPKVSLRTGEITGVEALIRWQREDGQLVPPNDFIPAAERTKLIVPMGLWVIEEACRQIRAWREAGLPEIKVAINVSAHQFIAGDVDAILSRALNEYDVSPNLLEIELTESVLMQDPDAAVTMLNRIKATGVSLSLDDFGTGYSSLAYLGRFPFDTLKIDRSFVQTMVTEPNSATIAMTIIDLAHRMRLSVVAEGVETVAQLGLLRKHGCDQIQGYLFSRPLAEPALRALLREDKKLPQGPNADLHQKTLLLVDDEPNIASALRRALRKDGYRILIAQSGEEALELMATNEVHVLLADQRMPKMTGTELLRRACVISPNTVRLILSGYTDLETVTRSVNEGYIYKFMTKPWEDDELRANIADAFRHSEMGVKQ